VAGAAVTALVAAVARATDVPIELTHLVAAAIIIPPIAYRLAQCSPRP